MATDEAKAAAAFGVEGRWPVLERHRIRWAECDMYAHVNHAAYLTLCEDLRVAHWVSLGGASNPASRGRWWRSSKPVTCARSASATRWR
jgi:hypothetical protein